MTRRKTAELARPIGLDREKFNDASRRATEPASPVTAPPVAHVTNTSTGDALLDAARKLGIETVSMTRRPVSEAIAQKTR
jgi:hypothetical protein